MQTDFEIDATALKNATQDAYGFVSVSFAFLVLGEDSWCYKIVTTKGQAFFLKLHLQETIRPELFELPKQLSDRGFKDCAMPIPTTDNKNGFKFKKRYATLYEWMDGSELMGQEINSDTEDKIGRLIARFHQAGKELQWADTEDFGNPFKTKSDAVLAEVRKGTHPDPQIEKFRKLYLSQIKNVEKEIENFHQAGLKCKAQPYEMTITHGDTHLANIFQKEDGDLVLIDWGDVKIAPIERDLIFFGENDWAERAYAEYKKEAGALKLDKDAMEYYRLTWNVGEAMDIGWRMFFMGQDETRKDFYYKELDEFFDYSGIRQNNESV